MTKTEAIKILTEAGFGINIWNTPTGYCEEDWDEAFSMAIEALSAQPEIIRCKDCRFEDGVWYCNVHFMDVEPNGFCHLAERKER